MSLDYTANESYLASCKKTPERTFLYNTGVTLYFFCILIIFILLSVLPQNTSHASSEPSPLSPLSSATDRAYGLVSPSAPKRPTDVAGAQAAPVEGATSPPGSPVIPDPTMSDHVDVLFHNRSESSTDGGFPWSDVYLSGMLKDTSVTVMTATATVLAMCPEKDARSRRIVENREFRAERVATRSRPLTVSVPAFRAQAFTAAIILWMTRR